MDNRFRSRKYALAMFFAFSNTVGLFTGFMSDVQFVIAQGVILGMYGAANVMKGKQ